jgi:hypothetical protein
MDIKGMHILLCASCLDVKSSLADHHPGKLTRRADIPGSTGSPWSQHHAMADWPTPLKVMRLETDLIFDYSSPKWNDYL